MAVVEEKVKKRRRSKSTVAKATSTVDRKEEEESEEIEEESSAESYVMENGEHNIPPTVDAFYGCFDRRLFFNMEDDEAKSIVFRWLRRYRYFLFFVQLVASQWNFSTDAFKGLPLKDEDATILDSFILRIFRGYHQWDAVHFIHIAEHGYVLESSLAFFPLFPYYVRFATYCWASPFLYWELLHPVSAYLTTAVVLNQIFFYMSAYALFEVMLSVSFSYKQSLIAVILYGCNPASVFFSAAYSESLFCMLTFVALFCLSAFKDKLESYLWSIIATLLFCLAFAARANGIVNLGYLAFYRGLSFLFDGKLSATEKYPIPMKYRRRSIVLRKAPVTVVRKFLWFVLVVLMCAVFMCCVVFAFGGYQEFVFCNRASRREVHPLLKQLAREEKVPTMGLVKRLKWCRTTAWWNPWPPYYSHIQKKYWDVGFLHYWKLSKLPCFLMASPAIVLVVLGVRQTFFPIFPHRRIKSIWEYLAAGGFALPYALHAMFLTFGAIFFYNVEVLTRMLFSTPFPYIVLSRWMCQRTPRVYLSDLTRPSYLPFLPYYALKEGWPAVVVLYFLVYSIGGTAMHAMGLPFT